MDQLEKILDSAFPGLTEIPTLIFFSDTPVVTSWDQGYEPGCGEFLLWNTIIIDGSKKVIFVSDFPF